MPSQRRARLAGSRHQTVCRSLGGCGCRQQRCTRTHSLLRQYGVVVVTIMQVRSQGPVLQRHRGMA